MDQLLTIGALAQRCRLSRSALRFYDQCGLLQPVTIDPATGYRYYQETQVGVASWCASYERPRYPLKTGAPSWPRAQTSAGGCWSPTGRAFGRASFPLKPYLTNWRVQ